ncbi:LysR family transcriptional regulator [Tessaracoccus palaemonis]|uniref:LysR family transcriptional regulator n=1 Tax=Tessaracoccus palaemonis TaxID=2829499 RepID=A0ABX8SGU0_9ACTN|nr:LysR family transcriptional regulator [Tessaracoccus palaemonis]QXT62074.1 LysR family transcriptional regulator [Tessaracoccus palaemonis]
MNSEGLGPILADLPVLVELGRAGSVSGAAEALGMPQPTASRTLARLADRVGVELVARSGRGVVLTEAGRELARVGSGALGSVADALASLRREAVDGSAQLTIAYQAALGESFLPLALTRYRARHSAVTFRLVHTDRAGCLALVDGGDADVALVADTRPGPGRHVTALYREPLYLVVSRAHPLTRIGRAVRPEDVPRDELLFLGSAFGLYGSIRRILGEVATEQPFEADDYRVLRGLVAAGAGIAILPSTAAPEDDDAVELPIDHPAANRLITAVTSDAEDPRRDDVVAALRSTARYRWRLAPASPVA